MIILIGPSASGKTELGKLLEKHNIPKLVTYTTRNMRINEIDGKDYHFISNDTFKELINNDFFYEYTLYNKNYYGTAKNSITTNTYVILEPNGLESYKNNPNCISFYIDANSDILFKRMLGRGDSLENAQSRINCDKITFNETVKSSCNYVLDGTKDLNELVNEILEKIDGLH